MIMNHKKIYASGMIIRSLSKSTSNWRSENGLSKFMHENQCIGLSEIDTRAIVNILRAEDLFKVSNSIQKDLANRGCCIRIK